MINKKILFLLHFPPPVHGSSIMGKYIKDSRVINEGFSTSFVNLLTSSTIDEVGRSFFKKIYKYLRILFEVIIKILKFKPEIIYIAINAKGIGFYKDLPMVFISKIFSKRVVLHYHNKGVLSASENFINHLLYKYLFKNVKVILLSKRLLKDVNKYVNSKDVFYCPNGIHIKHNKLAPKKNKNKIPQLLFLSNLLKDKGVLILLEALKVLNDSQQIFNCKIVGGEGDISSSYLNEKIIQKNLSNSVKYLGKKYGDDKYEIINSSDIFIFPTLNECFGLVLLEAMSFGLPVIATNEGAIPDIVVNNETGFIVQKNNAEIIAEKIKWLINNPDESKNMGKNAKVKFNNHFTLDIFEKNLAQILNQI